MSDYLKIADHIRAELPKIRAVTDEELVDGVAQIIAKEFPTADAGHVRLAINAINQDISSGYFRTVDALRPIAAINITGLDVGDPANEQPICELVDPKTLYVDPMYQRNIGDRGLKKIRNMIEAWDWNRFSPPACCYAVHDGQTVLKVVDGQHTSIAAASHPMIEMIPVMIHDAPETATQALAFVGQNSGHLAVTALQLHKASLVARDDDALTIDQVCRKAGVRVLQYSVKNFEPGDTVAINAIAKLIDTRGAMKARIILEVLAKAKMAPILAPQIKAIELLLTDDEYRHAITAESLTEAIAGSWITDHDEGKRISLSHKWPFWKALAIHWFRNTKKSRPATGRAA